MKASDARAFAGARSEVVHFATDQAALNAHPC